MWRFMWMKLCVDLEQDVAVQHACSGSKVVDSTSSGYPEQECTVLSLSMVEVSSPEIEFLSVLFFAGSIVLEHLKLIY